MSCPRILIHLLVSLALILNGAGAGVASAVVATASASSAASAASQVEAPVGKKNVAMQAGCPEHGSSNSSSTLTSLRTSHLDVGVLDVDSRTGDRDSADCCKYGGCGCDCTHQSQVVLSAAFLVTSAIAPASMHLEQFAPPRSPPLSGPVRPPIA